MFRSNLFARLLVLVVAASLPALLVLAYLQHDLRQDRLSRIPDDALQQAELVNSDLRSVVEGVCQLGAAMARYTLVRDLNPACVRHMTEMQGDLPSYAVVSLRDENGALVCSSNPAAATGHIDQHCRRRSGEPEFLAVRTGLYTAAGPGRVSVLPFCVAFPASNGSTGYLILELSLDWLAEHVAELRLPKGSAVWIADAEGTVLVRVPERYLAGRKLPAALAPYADDRQRGTAWSIGPDGQRRMVGFNPGGIAPVGLFVSVGLLPTAILSDVDDAAWRGLWLMALGIMVSLLLAAIAGERFVRRPTAALLDAVRRWSDGDLAARAQLREHPGSEFGRLAGAFNAMAAALGRRRAELEELNATLEARVQQRTRDLEASRNRLEHEIAERERTEAELRRAQKLKAVGQLAGGIAHDFNNLLTAVVGALDLVHRRLPPGQQALRPLIENALDAAQRGGRLTAQLLAFSRQQRLLPVPTDLNVPVLALSGLLASTLGRNIRISTDLAPDLWPAMVDPTQVEAVILNLAINARDAMPDGGDMTIRTRNVVLEEGQSDYPSAAPGQYVALEVADNGCGIEAEVLARVFEPFFTTKPTGAGAGLGLSQVHGLAVQSGGDVRIASRPGAGTEVTVLLPRAAAEVARISAGTGGGEQRLRRLRVLIVDDDQMVREMVAEMLRERGHSVVVATEAAEALEILGGFPPDALPFDVMLADFVMPGMNGASLIQAVQERHPLLPALLVTGTAEWHSGPPLDSRMVMRKPFTIAELEERVELLLKERTAVAMPASS